MNRYNNPLKVYNIAINNYYSVFGKFPDMNKATDRNRFEMIFHDTMYMLGNLECYGEPQEHKKIGGVTRARKQGRVTLDTDEEIIIE